MRRRGDAKVSQLAVAPRPVLRRKAVRAPRRVTTPPAVRPLSFRIYDAVAASHRGAPDLSLLEMSRLLSASYGNVRKTLHDMERRGIVRRIYQGIYRLPDLDVGKLGAYIAAKDEYEGAKFEGDLEAAKEARRAMADEARKFRTRERE